VAITAALAVHASAAAKLGQLAPVGAGGRGGTAGSQPTEQGQCAYSGANRLNANVDPSDPAGPLRPGSYPVIEGRRAYDRVISDYTRPLCPTFMMGGAING
jgi:hypothetical protein